MALHKQISLYNTRTRFTLTDSRNSFVCMRLMKEQLKQSQSQPKPLGFTRKFNTTKPYISSLTGPPVDIWWVAFKKNLISIFPSSKSDCVSLLRGFGQTKPGLQISTDFSGQGRLPDGMMNDPLRRTEMKSLCLIDWTFQHSEWLIARQCNGSLASVYWAFWTHYSPNEPMWRRNTVCFRIDNYHIVFFSNSETGWNVLYSPHDRCTWPNNRAHRKHWRSGTDDSNTSEAENDTKNQQCELKNNVSKFPNPFIFKVKTDRGAMPFLLICFWQALQR